MQGSSEVDAAAHLEGDIDHSGRLPFRLEGPRIKGRGVFELDALGYTLGGEWVQDGQPVLPLAGQRVMPRPGLTWLVVLEAHWQRTLDDSEFAFGHMLHELFARHPRDLRPSYHRQAFWAGPLQLLMFRAWARGIDKAKAGGPVGRARDVLGAGEADHAATRRMTAQPAALAKKIDAIPQSPLFTRA